MTTSANHIVPSASSPSELASVYQSEAPYNAWLASQAQPSRRAELIELRRDLQREGQRYLRLSEQYTRRAFVSGGWARAWWSRQARDMNARLTAVLNDLGAIRGELLALDAGPMEAA